MTYFPPKIQSYDSKYHMPGHVWYQNANWPAVSRKQESMLILLEFLTEKKISAKKCSWGLKTPKK